MPSSPCACICDVLLSYLPASPTQSISRNNPLPALHPKDPAVLINQIPWNQVKIRLKCPKGPKIEKIQDRPPGLKFSIEIEHFNLDTQQRPIFCGEFWRSGLKFSIEIEIFKRDWNFQSRLNFFNLWALRVRLKSGRNPFKSCVSEGTGRTPAGSKR